MFGAEDRLWRLDVRTQKDSPICFSKDDATCFWLVDWQRERKKTNNEYKDLEAKEAELSNKSSPERDSRDFGPPLALPLPEPSCLPGLWF